MASKTGDKHPLSYSFRTQNITFVLLLKVPKYLSGVKASKTHTSKFQNFKIHNQIWYLPLRLWCSARIGSWGFYMFYGGFILGEYIYLET